MENVDLENKSKKLPSYVLNAAKRYREKHKEEITQKFKANKLEKDKIAIETLPNNELTKPQLLLKVEYLEKKLKDAGINI
jgi:hypothetical protein